MKLRIVAARRTALLFLLAPLLLAAEDPDRIRALETGLTPRLAVKGRPVPRYTIQERMKAMNVNGVSLAVIEHYEIAWAKGYGLADVASKRPVTADTLFQAGSISKPVAAFAALSLVEQGKVKLDQDINSYLKSWKVPENEFTSEQKVTLRRILSHMSGLTGPSFQGYSATSPVPSMPQILDGLKPANSPAVRVDLVPGTRFRYSGGGYIVAQLMMTEVTGEPFPDLMKRTVLSKAGMRQSTYENPLPARLTSLAATGYKGDGEACEGRFTPTRRWPRRGCGPPPRTSRGLSSRSRNRARAARMQFSVRRWPRRCCSRRISHTGSDSASRNAMGSNGSATAALIWDLKRS